MILSMNYLPLNCDSFPFQIQMYLPSQVLISVIKMRAKLIASHLIHTVTPRTGESF